ncbi:restriction endonuclease subunit S [Vreelandella sulfidaeris]|uniref:restriction endonuclease subunit S n=1 Tax=Vreelandella sulfidaeris TaxID=115553 RepID=UPI00142DAE60|nr:restriction endonuclease subunit S [Halomonas sulfidaeris]
MSAHQLITENLDLWTQAVTKKSTAGRGRSGKTELTGIKKLRELILELAVRGKLVEQDPDDEPASRLLERIAESRKALIAENRIKNSKPLPSVSPDEFPSALPFGWVWTRLGSIAEINPRNAGDDSLEVSFIPMPLVTTSYHGEHGDEPRNWGEIKKSYSHFANGDVGLAKITPCFENSKAAVFRNLRNGIGAGTTELHVARPLSSAVNPYFLLLFLKSPRFLSAGEKVMTGSAGQKRVPKDYFSETPLPLPPEQKQHRIVQKVDELMALCDRLEQHTSDQLDAHATLVDTLLGTLTQFANATELADNWACLAEHFDTLFTTEQSIDKLKQTILQLAVMGRLVKKDAGDESATDFLTQIHTRKVELANKKIIKRPRELTLLKDSEHSYIAPSHWTWTSFQDVADEISTGPFGSMIHKHDYVEGGIPLINPSHMFKGHIKEDLSVSVSLAKAEELSSYRLANGDIVMARRGEVGRCAAVTDREAGWLCGTGSFVLKFHPAVNRQFILLLFSTDTVRNYLTGNSVGTTMTNLNHGILKKMPVAVPPAKEQHRIVQKVDELMAICDQLKERLNQASDTRCQLAGAVVEQAIN